MPIARRNFTLGLLMLSSASAAMVFKPRASVPDPAQRVDYEKLVPSAFGTWRAVQTGVASVVNPQQQAVLDKLYSQIVSRVYVDSITGKMVMLSLAYGERQDKQSQVHLPEVCYPAQGF